MDSVGRLPKKSSFIEYLDGLPSFDNRSSRWSGAGSRNLVEEPMKTALLLACALGAMFSSVSVEEPGFSVTVTASGLN